MLADISDGQTKEPIGKMIISEFLKYMLDPLFPRYQISQSESGVQQCWTYAGTENNPDKKSGVRLSLLVADTCVVMAVSATLVR